MRINDEEAGVSEKKISDTRRNFGCYNCIEDSRKQTKKKIIFFIFFQKQLAASAQQLQVTVRSKYLK